MKKVLFVALALIASMQVSFAQDDEVEIPEGWHNGGAFAFNFSQAQFQNWAAGGVNNITGVLSGNLFANYKMGKHTWDNRLNLGYGMTRLALEEDAFPWRKTDDLIDLYSKYGYRFSNKWSGAALFNFRTQFTDGFQYIQSYSAPDTSFITNENLVSKLFAPAYVSFGLGADYKPNDNFSLYISPITARWVIVADDALSAAGAFGVTPGENVLTELGANLVAAYNTQLTETITFTTGVNLFYDYLGEIAAVHTDGNDETPIFSTVNPGGLLPVATAGEYGRLQTIDVNWTAGITAQLWKVIAVSLNTHLIWDYNTRLTNEADPDGEGGFGFLADPKLQFKEVLGIGLTYTFNNLKE